MRQDPIREGARLHRANWRAGILGILLVLLPVSGWAQSVDELFEQGEIAYEAGDSETLEQLMRQVLQQDPDNVFAHNNLGTALRAQGKLEEAIGSFRRALELDRPGS